MEYIQDPLPNVDFDERDVKGNMPATEISGGFIAGDKMMDYTFSGDAQDNWENGDIKKIMSDVIANYEDNKRNEYKSRGDNRNKGSFRLLPTELFYTYVNNRETLILHTFGETTKNLNSILTGDSYLFVYRTIDKKRNLDVLRIDNVDNHLRSIETFEVLKNDDVNKYRSWRMKRRQNKIRAAKSDRKKEYLENIQKTSSEIGYRMNINNDREFPWFI